MVAGFDRHGNPDVIPPVQARTHRQDDSMLGRRLVGARRDEQPGATNPVWIELLDDDAVE